MIELKLPKQAEVKLSYSVELKDAHGEFVEYCYDVTVFVVRNEGRDIIDYGLHEIKEYRLGDLYFWKDGKPEKFFKLASLPKEIQEAIEKSVKEYVEGRGGDEAIDLFRNEEEDSKADFIEYCINRDR